MHCEERRAATDRGDVGGRGLVDGADGGQLGSLLSGSVRGITRSGAGGLAKDHILGAERPSTVFLLVTGMQDVLTKYGTGKSTSCEELKIPDRTVHLEEQNRIIMGMDPGPGNGTDLYLR